MDRQRQQASQQWSPYIALGPSWRRGRTSTDLAAEMRQELSFALAQASWQLSSPRDQELLQVAGMLLGYPYGPEVQILADAIILAGAPKGSGQRQRAEQRALMTGAGLFANTYLR